VARLVEAHADAVAILAEGGRAPIPGRVYGVWASEPPGARLEVRPGGRGWVVEGPKHFCSGLGICDAALVTAFAPGDGAPLLVEVDLADTAGRVRLDTAGWATPALAETCTGTISFLGLEVADDAVVGDRGWYLDRPGFWHGAMGPAAVWAGGAQGLVDRVLEASPRDDHDRARRGALRAEAWALGAVLDAAGDAVDADPADDRHQATARALGVRHVVEGTCTRILDLAARALGPGPLAFDRDVSQQIAGLALYIRQDHGEADLALLDRSLDDPEGDG
jgi:alkylation response protein AidB-like acyl-CoA dehydrogenase